jgi:hypothetical protein
MMNLKKAWELVSTKKSNKKELPFKENDDDEPTRKLKRFFAVSICKRIISMNLS